MALVNFSDSSPSYNIKCNARNNADLYIFLFSFIIISSTCIVAIFDRIFARWATLSPNQFSYFAVCYALCSVCHFLCKKWKWFPTVETKMSQNFANQAIKLIVGLIIIVCVCRSNFAIFWIKALKSGLLAQMVGTIFKIVKV